jgi:ParB family transcriptional regulator, chromosome partitioning protein
VTTETTTNDPVTLPGAPVQVVEYDPATLLVDVNVRHDVRLDKVFVASIEENGVLSPVVAVRTRDGDIRVRLGHRRVLAALEVGRRVPVAVVGDESGDDADQIERLVAQFAENEHRLSLTTAERVDVVEQLSLLGVPAAQIVKRTRIPRKQVASALVVAGSELAKGAAARHEFLTLDQAAAVAEFDQDTEAVKALLAAAKTGQFAHIVQRLRDERDEAQARSAAEADLAATGVRVVERSGVAAPQVQPLYRLAGEGPDGELTPEEHAECPGHAAYLMQQWQPRILTSGDDNGDDDEVADDAEDTSGETGSTQWVPVFVCTDALGHGHAARWGSTETPRAKVADLPPEEREAARLERRRVIENNKAWASAETVRRAWLKEFATRSKAPRGTAAFLAVAAAHDADVLADVGGNHLAAKVLGIESSGYGRSSGLQTLVANATSDARAQVIHLVMVLAAYEAATSREDWRTARQTTRRYLAHIATLGYGLADVERLALGEEPEAVEGSPAEIATTASA